MFSCLIVVSESDDPSFLDQALDSVISKQTVKAARYVIVRNGKIGTAALGVIDVYKNRHPELLNLIDISKQVILSEALNMGINECLDGLIARMDPDDISRPQRFQKQLEYFSAYPDTAVCGTWVTEFIEGGDHNKLRSLPVTEVEIRKYTKFRNPLAHPSVMFRKNVIERLGGYPNIPKAQDYLLWVTLIHHGYKVANLPESLLDYRVGSGLTARRDKHYLKSEIQVFQKMRHLGEINFFQFWASLILRNVVRRQPESIREIFYMLRS